MDKSEAEKKAKALLLKEGLEEKSYKQLRDWKKTGFAHFYLYEKRSYEVKLATLLEFFRFDLTLGTTIAELVFSCCQVGPRKTWIKGVGRDRSFVCQT